MEPYCKVHLNRFQIIVGSDNWVEFLQSEHRLWKVMVLAVPDLNLSNDFHNGGKMTWVTIVQLVANNWFGLWPNPSPREVWIGEQIRKLCSELIGLCPENNSDQIDRLCKRYARLSQQSLES